MAEPRRIGTKPARWPLVLAIALSLIALLTLIWLRGRLIKEETTQLQNAAGVFSELLLRPENDSVDFSSIENNVDSFINSSDFISEILVSKNSTSAGEVLIRPYYHALLNPDWKQDIARWQKIEIGDSAQPDGWLYIRIAPANREAVDRAIILFGLFLVVCLGVLVSRTRGTEVQLSKTVSELEQRKAEVIRLERLALAGQLSANIFHDIKKPVLNIKHEAYDALDRDDLTESEREALETMRDQTELFFNILRDLGFEQFVRAEHEDMEYCDIKGSIERSLSLVQYEQGDVNVSVNAPEDHVSLPLILAPPHRLIQLFSNLILNAYQAMSSRGQLVISIRREQNFVVAEFKDNGPGISSEVRDKLFEPFATTKGEQECSGLGLYICAQIAEELGGSVKLVESNSEGTTFRVSLPGQSG